MSAHEKLCANCDKRPRAGRLPWCRPCLDAYSRRAKAKGAAIGKVHRMALRDWQRPIQPRTSGGRQPQ